MSIEVMRQALEALETLARYENPETRIQVRKPKDGGPIVTMYPHKVATDAADDLRTAIAEAEKQEPHELLCVCGATWCIYADSGEELVNAPPAAQQEPVAWMYDFLNSDNREEVIRDWMTQDYADIARENGFNVRPLYTAPPATTHKPVAYVDERIHGWPDCFVMEPDPPHTVPLYAAPRQWVGLTDEEYTELWGTKPDLLNFFRKIEAKLKEKNT